MPRAAVIVPFPYDEEGLDYRRAELEQVELSGNVTFDYKPLKAGPMHFLVRHDEMLVEFAILEAGMALALAVTCACCDLWAQQMQKFAAEPPCKQRSDACGPSANSCVT